MKMMKTRKLGIMLIAAVLLVALAFAGVGIAEDDFEDDFEDDYEESDDINAKTITSVIELNAELGGDHQITANTLKLTHDVELAKTLTIKNSEPSVAIILDLNGYTISPSASDYRFATIGTTTNSGNFTLVDTNETKKGAISGFVAGSKSGGGFNIQGGLLTLSPGINIKYCSAKYGGGIYVGNTTKLIMNGGSITNCSATNGGGVLASDGKNDGYSEFIMSGGSITNCSATNGGGGVFIKGPKVTFKVKDNAIITGNTGKDRAIDNLYLNKQGGVTALINLTGDFIGQIGISYPKSGSRFGVAELGSYKGAQNFVLDSTISSEAPTVGTIDGNNDLVWSANGHYVTFHLSDGSTGTTWKQTAATGGPVTDPSASLTKEGYVLDGWYNDDAYQNKWNFADPTTADTNLYARWAQPPATTYNVTIALGIQHGDVKVSQKSATPGTTIIVTPIPDDGYAFKELIVKDKSGNPVKPATETTFIMPTSDVIVSAVFVEEPEPVVSKNRGHSASIPKDYTPSGYVPPMMQETAHATATPTPAAPTMMPTTKPIATTSKSPAPLAGLVAGLGAAALLIRMR